MPAALVPRLSGKIYILNILVLTRGSGIIFAIVLTSFGGGGES